MFFCPFVLFFLSFLYSLYPPVCDACFCTCILMSSTKYTYNELYHYNCLAYVCENMGFVEVISPCWRNSVAAVSSGGHWMASQLQVWQWKCGNVRMWFHSWYLTVQVIRFDIDLKVLNTHIDEVCFHPKTRNIRNSLQLILWSIRQTTMSKKLSII